MKVKKLKTSIALMQVQQNGETADRPYRAKRGRPTVLLKLWAVNPFDARDSSTSALISMCIKDDRKQTLEQLAARVAEEKCRPLGECLSVLREMLEKGTLGTFEYDDYNKGFYFKRWKPEAVEGDDLIG